MCKAGPLSKLWQRDRRGMMERLNTGFGALSASENTTQGTEFMAIAMP